MHRNSELYEYIIENSSQITERWLQSLGNSTDSVYSLASGPVNIEKLRVQNSAFVYHITQVFKEERCVFMKEFQQWIEKIAEERTKGKTPLSQVIKQFKSCRKIYLDTINQYIEQHVESVTLKEGILWVNLINETYDEVVESFVEKYQEFSENLLQAQQNLIIELSSPVIPLSKGKGVLPLVGDIDTYRAKWVLESTLEQCLNKGISHLYIDLSGVPLIDTLVAQQLFQLINALRLIGVSSTLSGLRPELAKTAIQLGIDFSGVTFTSNLEKALSMEK